MIPAIMYVLTLLSLFQSPHKPLSSNLELKNSLQRNCHIAQPVCMLSKNTPAPYCLIQTIEKPLSSTVLIKPCKQLQDYRFNLYSAQKQEKMSKQKQLGHQFKFANKKK